MPRVNPFVKFAKESEVQHAIMQYLARRRVLAFRMNSGVSFPEYKGKVRKIAFGTPGMADILAFLEDDNLMPVWLEVKSATGKQTLLQMSFQRQVQEHGHRYAVVRSIEDVEKALGDQP